MMTANEASQDQFEIDLRHPATAALLAWLIPGAGHFYQRRYAKGAIFSVCVLACYFIGLAIGDGHVVYASWTQDDPRWQFVFQAGVGLPAMPALVQNRRVMRGEEPLVADILAPPRQPVEPRRADHLASWHQTLGADFELGTLYTMIAGLLNVLAIYDAYAGPLLPAAAEPSRRDDEPDGDAPDDSTA